MSRVFVLLCLAGCGRVAFEELQDPGVMGPDGGALVLPPEICRSTATFVGVPGTDIDLVATPLAAGGVAAAWLGVPATAPAYVSIDDAGAVMFSLDALDTFPDSGDIANSLVDLGDRMYLVFHDGEDAHHIAFGYAGNVLYNGLWRGVPGRDCVSRDGTGAAVWMGSTGSLVESLYLTTSPQPGTRAIFETNDTLVAMACHDGRDHVHAGWQATDDDCKGLNVDTGGPMPVPGGTTTLSSDCVDGRSALVDETLDTSIIVWTTASGAIDSAFATLTVEGTVPITTNGRGPRVRSDGSLLWFAWTDLRGGEVFSVGHRTRTGALTTIPLPGVVPAGPESYELIREGSTVSLVVLTTDGFVRVLELCAS